MPFGASTSPGARSSAPRKTDRPPPAVAPLSGSRRRDNSIPIPLRRLAIGVYTKYDTVVLRGRRKVKALKDRGRGGLKQGQEAKDAGKGA